MRIIRWRPGRLLAALVLGGSASVQADASGNAIFLFQRLGPQTRAESAATLSIALAPSAWRVGAVDGPAASAAQLDAVLTALQGIVITGLCADDAHQLLQCEYSPGAPQFAGLSSMQTGNQVLGWVATDRAAADSAARYFGLLQPQRYSTPESAAFGARLAFHFGSVSGKRIDVALNADGAVLVLHNDGRGRLATLPWLKKLESTRRLAGEVGRAPR